MSQWKPILGAGFEAEAFDTYCQSLSWVQWRPSFVALHNTATPDLKMRPNGFTAQHMQNLVGYYRDKCKWRAGPHLFVDDHLIWVFTPLTTTGRHSPSWNASAIGVEMLGNYDHDRFDRGRGLAVRRNAVSAIASLSAVLGLDPATLRLHKEDPETTHDCPGSGVSKAAVVAEVRAALKKRYDADHDPGDPLPA